jgi:hypothetical protein
LTKPERRHGTSAAGKEGLRLKAGLVTFYHLHHYGAILQAAATQRALASLGWECETIDYFVGQDIRILKPPTTPARAANDAYNTLHYPALKRRWQRFEDFSRANLNRPL